MVEGQRYLFLSYGPLSSSGILKRVFEVGPGAIVVEITDVTSIGETGDISEAAKSQKYADNQAGPLDVPSVLIPWHDISQIIPQRG